MGATNINRWIGIGLLGLPLYGALTVFSSLNPQPDPNTHLEAWASYVTTDFRRERSSKRARTPPS